MEQHLEYQQCRYTGFPVCYRDIHVRTQKANSSMSGKMEVSEVDFKECLPTVASVRHRFDFPEDAGVHTEGLLVLQMPYLY